MNTQRCMSDADLGRLWEGDVTPQERQGLEQHIQSCPDCSARWQRMSDGAQYVADLFSKAASQARAAGGCLSADVLTGYVNQTLEPEDRLLAERHLADCHNCRDALAGEFAAAYETEGDTWWSQYVGEQILGLLARLPEGEIDGILEMLNTAPAPSVQSQTVIRLSVFEPAESQATRLAAATGEGIWEQRLHQDEPPFDFHVVQIGEQVRVSVRPAGAEAGHEDCLGSLQFMAADRCLCTRVILIEKGEGRCILEPHQARAIQPEQADLVIRFVPAATLAELSSMGSEAYRPMLEELLRHNEPQMRQSAIAVAARIYGPQAESLIRPLLDDPDDTVRSAAGKALGRFPR